MNLSFNLLQSRSYSHSTSSGHLFAVVILFLSLIHRARASSRSCSARDPVCVLHSPASRALSSSIRDAQLLCSSAPTSPRSPAAARRGMRSCRAGSLLAGRDSVRRVRTARWWVRCRSRRAVAVGGVLGSLQRLEIEGLRPWLLLVDDGALRYGGGWDQREKKRTERLDRCYVVFVDRRVGLMLLLLLFFCFCCGILPFRCCCACSLARCLLVNTDGSAHQPTNM